MSSTAPDLTLHMLDGGTQTFPHHDDGGLSILVFWSTWSQPALEQLERMGELSQNWQAHGVRIAAVNVESSRIGSDELAAVRDYLAEHPAPFPVALDDGLDAFHAYGVIAVPTTLVVDETGTIVHRLAGYCVSGAERFETTVENLVIDDSPAARTTPSNDTPEHRRAVRHMRLARLLASKGELELAQYTLEQAIVEDAGLLQARLELADLYEQVERSEEAGRVLDKAALVFLGNSRLLLARADRARRLGALGDARALAREALDLEPENGAALVLMARILLASEDTEGAMALLRKAAASNLLDAEARIELGALHERLGNTGLALDWYERAYQILDPTWTP